MASHGQHCSHGPKTTLKKSGSSFPLQPIFQTRIFQNYLNCIAKGQKEHTKCYMISNPTPTFTSQIRSIRSVFGRNRTGTGSEKIDRISGRTLIWNSSLIVLGSKVGHRQVSADCSTCYCVLSSCIKPSYWSLAVLLQRCQAVSSPAAASSQIPQDYPVRY